MILLIVFLSLILAQRIAELTIARRHEIALKKRGAVEIDRRGYKFIVAMHSAFFVSIAAEYVLFRRPINHYWPALVAVFAAAQCLRYWAISSLGVYWNTKILIALDHRIVKVGPYRFMKHPNYVAVVTEIAVVPLVFSCYFTALFFTVLNVLVLWRRIRLETQSLPIPNS
jgi:methyltransferase